VEHDADLDRCYRCGYALRGIEDEQPCPECGLLARRSRRTTDELRYTRPRWLRRVSRGTSLLVLAIVVVAASPVLSLALLHLVNVVSVNWSQVTVVVRPSRAAPLVALIPLLAFDAAALLVFFGAWLLSSREGYPPADRADRRLRWSLRLAAFALVLTLGVLNVERYLVYQGGFRGAREFDGLTAASFVGGVVLRPAAAAAVPRAPRDRPPGAQRPPRGTLHDRRRGRVGCAARVHGDGARRPVR
jgi:hypothetical protein